MKYQNLFVCAALLLPLSITGCTESTVDSEVESEWRTDEGPEPQGQIDVDVDRQPVEGNDISNRREERRERIREAVDNVNVDVGEGGVDVDVE